MLAQETWLVTLVKLVDRIPMPPPPAKRGRGQPKFYRDRLFLKALVMMIVRHLHKVHELLSVLDQPTDEMRTLCALLMENGRYPTRRTWGGDLDKDGVSDPQEYARMLSYAYPALKAANPDAQLVFGSIAYETLPTCFNFSFMDQVLNAFSLYPAANFNAAGVHQYDFQRQLRDGSRPAYQGVLGKTVRPAGAGGSSRASVKTILSNHGFSNKPIIISELGLVTNENSDHRERQAQHLVHEIVRGLSAPSDIKALIWFTLKDFSDGTGWGLVKNAAPYNPNPAYNAYQTLIRQLDGYHFLRQLPSSETGSIEIQGYVFAPDGGGSNMVILWRDTGLPIKQENTSATSSMTISAAQLGTWTGSVRITDKYGNPLSTKTGTSSVVISFTTDPIYVQAGP